MKKPKRILPLQKLFKNHVEGTVKKANVTIEVIPLCSLTVTVLQGIKLNSHKVNINTRALKHMYDRRPQEEFALLLKYLPIIVKYPTYITENKPGRRGDFCFIKKITDKVHGEIELLCSIEKVIINEDGIINEEINITTAFWLRDKSYISQCKQIWSWKDDNPSS